VIRSTTVLLAIALTCSPAAAYAGTAATSLTSPSGIAAPAADLANAATGRALWGREQYTQRPIASITKVMTAYVVLETGHIGRYVTVTRADERYLGCCIQGAGLIPGDVLTVRQLLYAMLLPSGADAARALARTYGPGISAFVQKMNRMARRLGLARSHFTDFSGVDQGDVSTPRNLLLLGEAAMRLPFFGQVVRHRWHSVPVGLLHHSYFWRNSNRLLGSYPGAFGIKTGWTKAAGECLLFEATHDQRTLIGVVLHSAATQTGRSFVDATRLLNWGFSHRLRSME
jgi:serine-type D-Ala-D-Ala carboxypeptidase (penicillin-binding protein 5/6)